MVNVGGVVEESDWGTPLASASYTHAACAEADGGVGARIGAARAVTPGSRAGRAGSFVRGGVPADALHANAAPTRPASRRWARIPGAEDMGVSRGGATRIGPPSVLIN